MIPRLTEQWLAGLRAGARRNSTGAQAIEEEQNQVAPRNTDRLDQCPGRILRELQSGHKHHGVDGPIAERETSGAGQCGRVASP